MSDEDTELNEIVESEEENGPIKGGAVANILNWHLRPVGKCQSDVVESAPDEDEKQIDFSAIQWSKINGNKFSPVGITAKKLPPGFYEIKHSHEIGIFFEKINTKTENLVRLSDTNSEKVIDEIKHFWTLEPEFSKYNFPYKRGILLWGPAGSGKTSLAQLLVKDIVDRDGICIKFINAGMFVAGLRKFRQIQPETPIIVLLEDIESIIRDDSETAILNILDGLEDVRKCVFLATTNYPEKLGARIVNRPSRFDKRFKIGMPEEHARRLYFEHLFKTAENITGHDIDQWVSDTKDLSFAHLKELFISVVIFGEDYERSLKTIKSMREKVSSEIKGKLMGFSMEDE